MELLWICAGLACVAYTGFELGAAVGRSARANGGFAAVDIQTGRTIPVYVDRRVRASRRRGSG